MYNELSLVNCIKQEGRIHSYFKGLIIFFFSLFQLVPEHVVMTPEEKQELLER